MENEKKTGKSSARKPLLICIGVLLVVFIALLLRFYTRVAVDPMRAFSTPAPLPAPSASAVQTDAPPKTEKPNAPTPTPTLSPEEELSAQAALDFMAGRVNILLLGWDQSPEREDENSELYRDEDNNYRSDVMMLLSVDFNGGKATLISIPRDTMAAIYETTGRWKINAAFAKGGSVEGDGFFYAIKTVEHLLQMPIAHYVGVNMEGVKAVVDAMGGVDYEVDVRIQLNGRVLEEGYQHLNGQQVLDYCRARKRITGTNSKGANSDVGRADRQQRMLFAIFSQMKQKKQLVKLPKIYDSVKEHIHTDLNVEQIAALALFGERLDMQSGLRRYTLPGELVAKTPFSNASFYVLDTVALRDSMEELFGAHIQCDHRFGLAYVLAAKEAARAKEYIEAAKYLCALFGEDIMRYAPPRMDGYGYSQEYAAIYDALAALEKLCEKRPAWSEVDGTDDTLPARSEQERALLAEKNEALYEKLLALCRSRGLYREQVEKKRLIEELYKALPAMN